MEQLILTKEQRSALSGQAELEIRLERAEELERAGETEERR